MQQTLLQGFPTRFNRFYCQYFGEKRREKLPYYYAINCNNIRRLIDLSQISLKPSLKYKIFNLFFLPLLIS